MARGKRGSCPFLGPEHLLGLIAVAFLVTMIKYLPKMMQGRKGLLRKLLWGAVVHCSNRSWGWVSELTHHVIPDFKKQQVECRTGSKPQGLYPPLGDPLSLTAELGKIQQPSHQLGTKCSNTWWGEGVAISHSNHKKEEEKRGSGWLHGLQRTVTILNATQL